MAEPLSYPRSVLTRPKLRRKILKSLEVRIRKDSQSDETSYEGLLGLMAHLTSIISESSDVPLTHTAISCIDVIAEKYGKRDPGLVLAAADVISGPQGLSNGDDRLRLISLLCLASMMEVLGAQILPILPHALPVTFGHLEASLKDHSTHSRIHNAVYSFLGALLAHLPWMVTGGHLDSIFRLSHKSAASSLGEDADESRVAVLSLIAKRVDPKECFAAVERNWADSNGFGGKVCSDIGLIVRKPRVDQTLTGNKRAPRRVG